MSVCVCTEEGDGGGRGTIVLHIVVSRSLTPHPYKAGLEHVGFSPDQARNHQPPSAMICSRSRMKYYLYPAMVVRVETIISGRVGRHVSPRSKISRDPPSFHYCPTYFVPCEGEDFGTLR